MTTNMDDKELIAALRNACMTFDWGDLPDDATIPAVPLLRAAADRLEALLSANDEGVAVKLASDERNLLARWREGEFENSADAEAQDKADVMSNGEHVDASLIIEAWLTALPEAALATQPPTPASGDQMEVVARYDDHAATLTASNERAERAEEAEDEAKDCFWAIYPDWCEMKGHGISTEAARTELATRLETAEALNTTLSEALEHIAEAWPDDFAGHVAQAVLDRTALAALPAKQGGRDDGTAAG